MSDTEILDWLDANREWINNIEGPMGFPPPRQHWRIWADEEDEHIHPGGHGATIREAVQDAMRQEAQIAAWHTAHRLVKPS